MPTKTKTASRTNPRQRATTSRPASAKTPQDRKPKQTATMLTATVRGIDVEVAPEALDDWELMEAIAAVDGGDQEAMMQMPAIVKRLIGPDAYAKAKESVRDDTGRVSAEAMGEFVAELFTALAPNS